MHATSAPASSRPSLAHLLGFEAPPTRPPVPHREASYRAQLDVLQHKIRDYPHHWK